MMIQLTDKVWAVEVPDDLLLPEYCFEKSIGHMLDGEEGDDELVIRHRERTCGSPIGKITIDLPPSTWRFLFTTKAATEEDARKVVAWIEIAGEIGYYDYMHPEPYRYLKSWKESLRSLLRSKSLDPDKDYALIEKGNNDEVVS